MILPNAMPPLIIAITLRIGITIIYGIPFLRSIPLAFAEKISDVAVEKRFIPIIYLLIIFVLIPLCIIYFGK